ncbi:cytochrome P450 [Auriculariales sp. MPI-PUGE-AT-0066]|nr:cytochrome P450 [Auriculariales sp. MPI-PUGE-AT-0066]
MSSLTSLQSGWLPLSTLAAGGVLALILLVKRLWPSPLRHVPGPPVLSFWHGNVANLFDPEHGFDYFQDVAREYGAVARLQGAHGEDHLFVADPRALHDIVIRNTDVWEISDDIAERSRIVFGPGLFSAQGQEYKKQRRVLNRVFTPEYLRKLVPLFYTISYHLRDVLSAQIAQGKEDGKDIDVLNYISPYTPRDSPTISKLTTLRGWWPLISRLRNLVPQTWRDPLVRWIPSTLVQQLRETIRALDESTTHIFAERRKAAAEGSVGNVDIMSTLIKLNNAADPKDKMSEEELVAQLSILVLTAQDTTAGALARTLLLLAHHPDAQARLRAEIRAAKEEHCDELGYDQLLALPWLDAICRETLRVHTTAPMFPRIAKQDTVLPLLWPVKSTNGTELNELVVPKGTPVHIAIHAANVEPRIWGADAHVWRPERWTDAPLPKSVSDARLPGIYSNMMSFLGGPRACLGFRFSQLEMKLILFVLLDTFSFAPAKAGDLDWHLCTTLSPHVRGKEALGPMLPVRMSLLKE